MPLKEASVTDELLLDSGEEAGTAPSDRRFRPDVEGLRAVAILLVVLYHAGVPRLTGGYVGVDVFFVISGFVITGLLLRERKGTGGTSILDFYARRCRRILPAATLVILITVLFAYVVLGVVSGNSAADDGRWAAAFLSNFHFEAMGTNYFSASLPPSPLQNYWSLSVEEQFYVVYPTLFLVVAGVRGRLSLRARLCIVLGIVIAASYWLSIAQTASNPAAAYFSPFARAWELALGALVAVGTTWLKQVPRQVAAFLSWAGLAAIVVAAFAFNAQTAYPGSLVAIPVVGAALIIAGGAATPRSGAESLLGLHPFQWMGRRSYSLYLWHWPILIIAAERVDKSSLPLGQNLLLVLLALALSVVSYAIVENPIRHWRLPSKQSVATGAGLVIATIVVLSLVMATENVSPGTYPVTPASSTQVVLHQVAAASRITSVPNSVEPPVSQAAADEGRHFNGFSCVPTDRQVTVPICTLGDPHGNQLMVVYGDSHALMWIPALNSIAAKVHWRLVVLAKPDCPAALVSVSNPIITLQNQNGEFLACDSWHRWSVRWINEHKPNVLVATQTSGYRVPLLGKLSNQHISAAQWQSGFEALFNAVTAPNIKKVLLGSTPVGSELSPACLSAHTHDVQACSSPRSRAVPVSYRAAQQSATQASGAGYIDPTPWFCTATCSAIVGRYVVYVGLSHITATYAQYLQTVLGRSLALG
jgi:peptidoglycan/LPS O-acetylase OafA/YrhL